MNLACTLLGIWCGALTGPAYVIDGDTIRAIGSSGSVEVPPGAQTVDATGKTIIPGIFNLHAHVASAVHLEHAGRCIVANSTEHQNTLKMQGSKTLHNGPKTLGWSNHA